MPKFRFSIDRADKVYGALVLAADVARDAPMSFEVGPWDDQELRETGIIEISGPDEAADLVAQKWITEGVGFEVAD